MFLLSEFNLDMLGNDAQVKFIRFWDREQKFVPEYAEHLISCVKDKKLANLFSIVLKREVEVDDFELILIDGTYSMYGQYKGPPLTGEETEMPEGGFITWWLIIPESLIWEHNELYGPLTKSVRY